MTLNPQNVCLVFLQFVAMAQIASVNCDEMDGDIPRQPAKISCYAVARLMSFAQITCLYRLPAYHNC